MYFFVLVALMLAAFLWVTYGEVETTLVRASHARARTGAEQVASIIARSVSGQLEESAKLGRDSLLQRALRDPDASTVAAAQQALAVSRPFRRVELWSANGVVVLADSTPQADSAIDPRFIPALAAPAREGVGTIRAAGTASVFDIVVGIRSDSTDAAPVIGYLRRYGSITSSSAEAIRRLIGAEATVKLGSFDGNVWTDFESIVTAPQPSDTLTSIGDGNAADGQRWVAAIARVEATPWVVWVGFPHRVVLAPGRSFLARMITLGLAFVAVGLILVVLLSIRLTQPLHALAKAAEQIAAGNYAQRVRPGRPDEIGRLSEIFNIMSDRVEEAHRALRTSHEQTHFALAAARIGVWELHVASGRMICSDSMAIVLGISGNLPQHEADFLAFIHPEDRDIIRDKLERSDDDSQAFDISCRVLDADGSVRWLEGKARRQLDASGHATSLLGVSVDVTERRELEGQFRQAQKMEAVGQLAGGIAHDFNNLLAAIMTYSELLLQDYPSESATRSDVLEIHAAAKRAGALTRQLLAYSRKQLLQPAIVNLQDITEEVASMLRRLLDPSIDLQIRASGAQWDVLADPGQMEQVLMNLMVNARDAMPDGGRLSIEVAGVTLPAGSYPWVAVAGDYVRLSVADTGTGMSEATRGKIFDPFFTTKASGKGTGLGLSTVYGIVKQSGGHIVVESEIGRGTTFTNYFPRHLGERRAGVAKRRPVAGRAGRTPSPARKLVMVIDDEPSICSAIARILVREGYQVFEALAPDVARQLATEHHGQIDLILADIMMPGTNGRDLVDEILSTQARAQVIFMSGFSGDTVRLQGMLDQGVPFIGKPFALEDVVAKVRDTLAGSSATPGLGVRHPTPTSGRAV